MASIQNTYTYSYSEVKLFSFCRPLEILNCAMVIVDSTFCQRPYRQTLRFLQRTDGSIKAENKTGNQFISQMMGHYSSTTYNCQNTYSFPEEECFNDRCKTGGNQCTHD